MKRLCLVKDSKVDNVCSVRDDWSGSKGQWQPPEGYTVVESELGNVGDSYIDGSFVKPDSRQPTLEDRIDSAFPKTDMAMVIFEAFFEVANRLQVLEGKPSITRSQLRDWLKSKLPG